MYGVARMYRKITNVSLHVQYFSTYHTSAVMVGTVHSRLLQRLFQKSRLLRY